MFKKYLNGLGKSSVNNIYCITISVILIIAGFSTAGMIGLDKNNLSNNAYAAESWYVGKGVQPNMYVTYKIQNHDTNQGQPFIMTIYFKQFDTKNNYWIAPVFVVDQGKVINGTFHLSDLDLSVLGSSDVPLKLSPYRSAYTGSLQWLAAFVPKPGQSLSAPYWGKIASIGGSPIAPGPAAKVTVPAGTFDTTTISYHKGVDNNIWVNKDLPYPVKASTFADVTTGSPPVQYAFDLLAKGNGKPPVPKSEAEVSQPPMTLQTGRGTYYIQLLWDPKTIKPGDDTKFGILFMDNSKSLVTDVSYSFKATDSDGKVVKDSKDQKAPDGTGTQVVKFTKGGAVDILVSIDAVAGQPSGEFIENSDFNLLTAQSSNSTTTPQAQSSNSTTTPQVPGSQ
jgi:hypothetical protein